MTPADLEIELLSSRNELRQRANVEKQHISVKYALRLKPLFHLYIIKYIARNIFPYHLDEDGNIKGCILIDDQKNRLYSYICNFLK